MIRPIIPSLADGRCLVMGVLNVTPDSFSDGGRFVTRSAAVEQAARMVHEGADLLDVGGESTRPGAEPVSADEELSRVIPVIETIRAEFDLPISIDSNKPQVMREAVAAGAAMINDVSALTKPGAVEAAAALDVPVCLMHMRGEPRTMQEAPEYEDVVAEVCDFLKRRVGDCRRAGIAGEQLIVDPGFGFGKTLAHNLSLLRNLDRVVELGHPVLVGVSRKSMLGQILDRPLDQRLSGGLAMAVWARLKGASVIRTHDVAETVDALRVLQALSS